LEEAELSYIMKNLVPNIFFTENYYGEPAKEAEMGVICARMREMRIGYNILVQEHERLSYGRRKWKDNIKTNVKGNEVKS
jgi:hypothetical protein